MNNCELFLVVMYPILTAYALFKLWTTRSIECVVCDLSESRDAHSNGFLEKYTYLTLESENGDRIFLKTSEAYARNISLGDTVLYFPWSSQIEIIE